MHDKKWKASLVNTVLPDAHTSKSVSFLPPKASITTITFSIIIPTYSRDFKQDV